MTFYMSTTKTEKMKTIDIINRMIEAADVKNPAKLAVFIDKDRSTISNWKKNNIYPGDAIKIVSLKTGYSEHWIKTGEGEPKETNQELIQTINESTDSFVPGLQFDGAPLSKREKNELSILRYLEKNKSDLRQHISDEILEIYILAIREIGNKKEG